MTKELDDDTLERFAIEVEHLPAIYAQEEYERMVAEASQEENI
jgi:hypothetical protein